MRKFVENIIGIVIYAAIFYGLIAIGGWGLTLRESISLSLILGFFTGLINNIVRFLQDRFNTLDKRALVDDIRRLIWS